MNTLLEDNINQLTELCKTYKVKSMFAFGSVCTSNFKEESDIDFLIDFENLSIDQYTDNYFELHYKLEDLFKREIDLVTKNSLSNPYFIKGIENTKKLIYAS